MVWLSCVMGLYILQTLIPNSVRYFSHEDLKEGLGIALGGRDEPPEMPVMGGRAERALNNMKEALPIFVTLALLTMLRGPEVEAAAGTGAMVFFIARALYVPAYLSGIPGLRSAIWMVSCAGLGMMAYALA